MLLNENPCRSCRVSFTLVVSGRILSSESVLSPVANPLSSLGDMLRPFVLSKPASSLLETRDRRNHRPVSKAIKSGFFILPLSLPPSKCGKILANFARDGNQAESVTLRRLSLRTDPERIMLTLINRWNNEITSSKVCRKVLDVPEILPQLYWPVVQSPCMPRALTSTLS